MHIGIDASRAFVSRPTGTENYSLNLIEVLGQIDYNNSYTLYIRNNSYQTLGVKFPDNFKFKVIPWPYLWTQAGLASECIKEPPDVLFIPAHTLPLIRRPSLKTVVTIHDLGAEFLPQYHQFPHKLYLNKSTEYAVKQATHLIAVSKSTKDSLIAKLHCDSQRISVIYEGYDDEKFNPQASKKKLYHETESRPESLVKIRKVLDKYKIKLPYILFVGTIQPRKNLVRLIEAFSIVSSKASSISLIIAGKPGWTYEEIYSAPEKFRVEERVRFLDYIASEDLPIFYQNAHCFVLPSLYEGFGLPVLEAMACGCPVVVSKTSSLTELVGEAGLLVNPLNINDIAENLQSIINNSELREDLIKKGLKQVKKFSWEKCARETLKVIENVWTYTP